MTASAATTEAQPSHSSLNPVKKLVAKIRPSSHSHSHSHSNPDSSNASSISCPIGRGAKSNNHKTRHNNEPSGNHSSQSPASTSLSLWSTAYGSLQNDSRSAGLVQTYERIIGHQVPNPLKPRLSPEGTFPREDRLELMRAVAVAGLERTFTPRSSPASKSRNNSTATNSDAGYDTTSSACSDREDDMSRDLLVQARESVAAVLRSDPSSAIGWAGLCSLTPLLVDPLYKHKELADSLAYLIAHITTFTSLAHIMSPAAWIDAATYETHRDESRRTLLELYRRALELEMNCVCAAASAWHPAARNVVDWRGWPTLVEAMKTAHGQLREGLELHGSAKAKENFAPPAANDKATGTVAN